MKINQMESFYIDMDKQWGQIFFWTLINIWILVVRRGTYERLDD